MCFKYVHMWHSPKNLLTICLEIIFKSNQIVFSNKKMIMTHFSTEINLRSFTVLRIAYKVWKKSQSRTHRNDCERSWHCSSRGAIFYCKCTTKQIECTNSKSWLSENLLFKTIHKPEQDIKAVKDSRFLNVMEMKKIMCYKITSRERQFDMGK